MDFVGWCNHQVVATEEIGQTFLQGGRQENPVVVLRVADTWPIVKVLGDQGDAAAETIPCLNGCNGKIIMQVPAGLVRIFTFVDTELAF